MCSLVMKTTILLGYSCLFIFEDLKNLPELFPGNSDHYPVQLRLVMFKHAFKGFHSKDVLSTGWQYLLCSDLFPEIEDCIVLGY